MNVTPIYLDYPTSTPIDPRVLETINIEMTETYGNPSNLHHSYGRIAFRKLEDSREKIARLLKVKNTEVFFTSGATESNNIILQSFSNSISLKSHIVTSNAEHKSVLVPCEYLASKGHCKISYLPLAAQGQIQWDYLPSQLTNEQTLVSLMAVNNESGEILNLKQACETVHEKGFFFHTDATQAVGRVPLDFSLIPVDFASFSSHKFYGPKGVGILFVREKAQKILKPLIYGGGQESGFRSGTSNVPSIIGMAQAFEIAIDSYSRESMRVKNLNKMLRYELGRKITGIQFLTSAETSVSEIINLGFEGVDAETLLSRLPGLALGLRSACQSEERKPSHVVVAYGIQPHLQFSFFRIGIGRWTTESDIAGAVDLMSKEVVFLRSL